MKKWFKRGKERMNGKCSSGTCTGCGYFLGFIGATVYYIQQSSTFWEGFVGVLKAMVWPAFLVYKLLIQ